MKMTSLYLFQFPEGRYYLLSLEQVAAWISDQVLSFLTKCTNDDSEDSEKQPLAAQITEVKPAVSFNIVKPPHMLQALVFSRKL